MSEQKTTHKYKDTLFRTLFGDSKHFLELYNAVSNEHYPDDTPVKLCPSNELVAKYNDLAACIGNQLIVFFEHQSTRSVNMPLRLLTYVTDMLNLHIIDKDMLYGGAQVKIPTPKFYVMYNGEQGFGTNELRLSDAFITADNKPSLELIAKVVDINPDSGAEALTRSATLHEYAHFINEIRSNLNLGMTRDKAILTAVELCIDKNILTDFLKENYLGVMKMLNWEYDAVAEKRVLYNEAHAEGKAEGKAEGADQLAKLIKEGTSIEEALKIVKSEAH